MVYSKSRTSNIFPLYEETQEKQEFVFINCFASKDKTRVAKIVSPISRPRKKRGKKETDYTDILDLAGVFFFIDSWRTEILETNRLCVE